MVEIQKITDVMQHIDGLKAVVFDLDDTLYSEKEYVKSGYHAIAQILPQVKKAEAKLWQAFEEKKSAIDEVLITEGIFSDELKQKCLTIYRFHQPEIHLYDCVVSMLIELRKRGYKLGIITDGRPEGQKAKIRVLDLVRYVDHIIITDELGGIGYRKPNDKSFLLMKEQFDIEYDEVCYVGDNTRKDFIAPEKLGMKSIWFKNTDGLYYQAE